ncbi:hypothetical protein [Rubrivirga sp. IMCC45206]|uniref:hypothetical protein n=1 Tax=Rubrivirga sp. IMCC45206 TaxID=3391614 RepID=UPI00398FC860
MKALVFALALATAASAQIIPDEFPTDEPMIDRTKRELTERHRPLLSGLFATSTLSAGPRLAQPELFAAVGGEAGYRFGSGHAVALSVAVQAPIQSAPGAGLGEVDDTAGALGLEYLHGLRRVGTRTVGRELAVGAGASFYGDGTVARLAVSPRIVVPLSPVLSAPVGLTLAQEIGDAARPGPFVGVTVGLRRIWADRARMVLE